MLEYERSLIALHHGWQIKTWCGDGGPYLTCGNESFHSQQGDLLRQALHLAQKSNILRLELLLAFGGVYIDTDIEPLKKLDPIIDDCAACVSPFFMDPERCNNSFLAAIPEHPWMKECVETLKLRDPKVPLSMGSSHITEALKNNPSVTILDRRIILQMPVWETLMRIGRQPDPKTHAIHHFASGWYPTGFEVKNADGLIEIKTGRF